MICFNCSNVIHPEQSFCEKCGTKIDEDFKKVIELIKKAEEGDAKSQGIIGQMYYRGDKSVKKDKIIAKRWIVAAAEQNDPLGYWGLGGLYLFGEAGFPVDYKKAVEFANKAIELGCSDGYVILGWMYHQGRGVAKDIPTAHKYYTLAADQGNEQAISNLGYLGQYYERGESVPQNKKYALELYSRASDVDTKVRQRKGNLLRDLGRFEEAVKEWYLYYKEYQTDENSLDCIKDNKQWKENINSHIKNDLLNNLKDSGETLVYYNPCYIFLNYKKEVSFTGGNSYKHFYGSYGTGYFTLTDRNLYICTFNDLRKLHLACKIRSSFLGGDTSHFKPLENIWLKQYDYSIIKEITQDPDTSYYNIIGTSVFIDPYWIDDINLIQAAISVSKNGGFSDIKIESAHEQEDYLKKLKQLKELRVSEIISEEEYETKKQIILSKMGL